MRRFNQGRHFNSVIKQNAIYVYRLIPRSYQQVEYLQSTGAQAIHTGINTTSSLVTTVNFSIASTYSYGNGSFIFGTYYRTGGGTNTNMYSVAFPSKTSARIPSGQALVNITIANISSGIHTLQYRFGGQMVDGTNYGTYSGVASATRELYLFGRNAYNVGDGGNVTTLTKGVVIYRCQLGTTADTTQYRDLIPCYRKADSVTGMYDLINSEFIPYTGSANFIVGNDVV